jgi:hypothetical protein
LRGAEVAGEKAMLAAGPGPSAGCASRGRASVLGERALTCGVEMWAASERAEPRACEEERGERVCWRSRRVEGWAALAWLGREERRVAAGLR